VLEQFLNHIERHSLWKPADRILLAVSGGIDSMVMLHLFQQAGFTIAVAHCNFQLRGKDADGDEAFVSASAQQLNIPFFVNRFETAQYAEVTKLSIQMAARELRYAWFEELMDKYRFNVLATAHHLNDSLETVLLNWVHGTSLEGFTGIPVKHGCIIRPLLFASREQIEQYAKENNITWREDVSNQSDDYQRNFIRHQVIPVLKEINPSLESTVQRGFTKSLADINWIQQGFDGWKEKYTSIAHDKVTIHKEYFTGLLHEASALWKFIKTFGFNYDTCADVVKSLAGQPGKRFFSSTHQLVIDRDLLLITPHSIALDDITIEADQSEAQLGSWRMEISRSTTFQKSAAPNQATLDVSHINFPLTWRPWKAGDAFYPLGMNNRKKVSDFLIDLKLSRTDKDSVTVLESQGEIIWVAGYRIDNRFKITDHTREVVIFTLYPHFL
jgi:tRNA(Ile)-lysidine synthase